MGEGAIGGEEEVHFLRTEDEIYFQCSSTNQKEAVKVALAAEGFGNRICYAELISNSESAPTDTPRCVFQLAQALSVRALHELLATPEDYGEEFGDDSDVSSNTVGKDESKTGHSRTLLYGNAVQLKHALSGMYLSCLSASQTSNDKLAFDVGLTAEDTGESRWWTVHPASKQRSEGEFVLFVVPELPKVGLECCIVCDFGIVMQRRRLGAGEEHRMLQAYWPLLRRRLSTLTLVRICF